jgi:hypothetical protein
MSLWRQKRIWKLCGVDAPEVDSSSNERQIYTHLGLECELWRSELNNRDELQINHCHL